MEKRKIDVDDHVFEVEQLDADTYEFQWLTGPRPYGFGLKTGNETPLSASQLEELARDFLADIDPSTGLLK